MITKPDVPIVLIRKVNKLIDLEIKIPGLKPGILTLYYTKLTLIGLSCGWPAHL